MLYHGSPVSNLKLLRPFRHPRVGLQPVTFATPDKRLAIAMIHGTMDDIAVGYYKDKKTGRLKMYVDEVRPGGLKLLDRPGFLYIVPKKGYRQAGKPFMPEEYISFYPAPVLKSMRIENVLDELLKPEHEIVITPYDKIDMKIVNERHR